MTKSLIVAAMLALTLSACNKSDNSSPPAGGTTGSTSQAPAGGAPGAPAGLSQLGGHTPGSK